MTLPPDVLAAAYLVSAVLFILGLKGLTHPTSAWRGNFYAIAGMAIAIAATVLGPAVRSYGLIAAGVVVGAVIGVPVALKIRMTAMPQLVALLHSFVGLTAMLVAFGTFLTHGGPASIDGVLGAELFAGTFIGAITFTGSLVAFAKLQALVSGRPFVFPGQHALNLGLALAMLALGAYFVWQAWLPALVAVALVALVLGVLLIVPIGGADMPVVVSMLNSYSGWAAAATGFTLGNSLLIITGALVGFSGAILSYIMSRAMNRSIVNIVLGGFGGEAETRDAEAPGGRTIKTAAVEDAVFLMNNASSVVIVPGYGTAVAQAQHALKELMEMLTSRGVNVRFAIHPVAGRMPGHMNVLLAEADVPYERVVEMDEVNPDFATTDVVLVVGANDVTNPAAKTDRKSPIYGMPILEVHKARHVFFIKRSMRPGYSGVENQLFYQANCSLVFGDAKKVCERMLLELKATG